MKAGTAGRIRAGAAGPGQGGAGPRLIQGAGILTIAAGLLRRDHMLLTSGSVSWHNHAHDVISAVIYADLVLAQLMLAVRFGRDGARAGEGQRRPGPAGTAGLGAVAAVAAGQRRGHRRGPCRVRCRYLRTGRGYPAARRGQHSAGGYHRDRGSAAPASRDAGSWGTDSLSRSSSPCRSRWATISLITDCARLMCAAASPTVSGPARARCSSTALDAPAS